jgi:hypothetical protein
MQPKTAQKKWGRLKSLTIAGEKIAVPKLVTRVEGGWEIRSTENPVHGVCFMDEHFQGSASLALQALMSTLSHEDKTINEAIELEWARCQEFPPYQIIWSHKDGKLISELVIYLFRYKDGQGHRQVKSNKFLISVGERITQRRINMVSEGALMTWLNYLSTYAILGQQISILTDFSRGSEKWREAVTGREDIFPKVEEHQPPKEMV